MRFDVDLTGEAAALAREHAGLLARLPASLELTFAALIFSIGVALPKARGARAWTTFWGSLSSALLVESEPPAIMTSASPRSMALTADVMAWRPEAQARVTVWPSTRGGRRRSRAISRATLGARPGRMTPPHTMPSSSSRGSSVRSRRAETVASPRAIVSILRNSENAFTKGVRTPSITTARRLLSLIVSFS